MIDKKPDKTWRYTLSPARFIFFMILCLLLSAGTGVVLFFFAQGDPIKLIAGGTVILLLLGLGVGGLCYCIIRAEDLLVIGPQGIRVNFTGLGRLTDIPWENVFYAKYYPYSIDQYALGIVLKEPTRWFESLSLPEKGLVKLNDMIGRPIINIQQNIVREPLSEAVDVFRLFVDFDDEMIYRLEHPERKKRNSIA